MPTERVVAVVPAYQAERTVADVVRRTRPFVERVVVVDDGSRDGTAAAAREAGAEVVQHVRNAGKGAALCTAFAILAREGVEAVLTLDADGQHLPEEAPKLLAVGGADLVLGVRSHLYAQMGRVRRTSNVVSSRLISWLAGVEVDDVQTGFRVYRRALLHPPVLLAGRFESESGVLVRAARRGLAIACVPVAMSVVDGRETSHYRAVVDSLRIARAVVGARVAWK